MTVEHQGLLAEAERIYALAEENGAELLVIGALALAAHHYVRTTADVDLAGNLDLEKLALLCRLLREKGYDTELRKPDADDPLGGVLDVRTASGLVQIVSFAGRFPAVIDDGLRASTLRLHDHSRLQVIPLPHLAILKLYAGGLKSKLDLLELLSNNPDQDLEEIETLCKRYRIRGFAEIRSELGR